MIQPSSSRQNRLIHEKSPYLLQHAHNPVDWYPWGEEAFAKARAEDKPILLSIGYSTCHWCHVMERECFENADIAAVMNENLVNIKLDREERPDIDKLYMTAVQAITGSGGWPLNVFLTPELRPFFGGTYFPPDRRHGRPAWQEVVAHIGRLWRVPEERKKMVESGQALSARLTEALAGPSEEGDLSPEILEACFHSLRANYDREQGGFGPAPKFPMPGNIHFLLRFAQGAKDRPEGPEALDMALATLRAMARGGLRDQVGGGFHRYSTDARWHVPHFEKMLYDNAQLAVNYAEAFQITAEPFFAEVLKQLLEDVRREFTHAEGAFFSALDADSLPAPGASHKAEGAFYVWEKAEILKTLGPGEGEIFSAVYGVEPDGNAQEDPFGEFHQKNILYQALTLEEAAQKFSRPLPDLAALLSGARQKLLTARAARPRPHLDDKILASWNGLMISGFARAHAATGDARDLESALRAARFIREKLYDEGRRVLLRRWREGARAVAGLADDYAFMAQAALDLYEACYDPAWLAWSVQLSEDALRLFYDKDKNILYMTPASHDSHMWLRLRDDHDNVEPAAASVALLTLFRLAHLTGRQDMEAVAKRILESYAPAMAGHPAAFPYMMAALDWALGEPRQLAVAGPRGDAATDALLAAARSVFAPKQVRTWLSPETLGHPFLASFAFLRKEAAGAPRAFLCVRGACQLPTEDPAALAEALRR